MQLVHQTLPLFRPSPAHGGDVTAGRAEQQVDDLLPFGLVLLPPRVLLLGHVTQVVIVVEAEHPCQLLRIEANRRHCTCEWKSGAQRRRVSNWCS